MAPTTADLSDLRLYTLAEVAEHTGLSLRHLTDGARARRFEHVHRGKARLMTAKQIRKLLDTSTVTAEADDELARERERHARGRSANVSRKRSA